MKKEKRRIGIRSIKCNDVLYQLYFTWSSTVAATLMMCSNCSELFIYDNDSILYGVPLKDWIQDKYCPNCNSNLKVTLEKYHFDYKQVKCKDPITEVETDALIDIYNLYS